MMVGVYNCTEQCGHCQDFAIYLHYKTNIRYGSFIRIIGIAMVYIKF